MMRVSKRVARTLHFRSARREEGRDSKRGSVSITASALSRDTGTWGGAFCLFGQASSFVDSLGLIPTKARLVESHDGTLGFHHSEFV